MGGSFVCISNRLKIFFFSLKSSGRKRDQEEWQPEAAPVVTLLYPGVHGGASKGGMSSEAPGIIHMSFVFV